MHIARFDIVKKIRQNTTDFLFADSTLEHKSDADITTKIM